MKNTLKIFHWIEAELYDSVHLIL